MDEEAEDRLTELARSRLDDTLSEAARLLSGPSSDAAPARRTERLGIDEVLLGLSRHPGLGLVSDPGPGGPGEPPPEHGASHASSDAAAATAPHRQGQQSREDGQLDPQRTAADGSGTAAAGTTSGEVPGRPIGLRTEVDQLRADVETARRRVEAAEARAEEHEAALEDLRKALGRLRHASHPPYERPSFASVVIGEPAASPSPALPVVAFSLGTVPSSPAVLHAAKLGSAPSGPVTTLTAQLVEDDHTRPPPSEAPAPPPSSAQPALPPAAADEGGSDPAPPGPAPTGSGPSGPSGPSGLSETSGPTDPTDEAEAGAATANGAGPGNTSSGGEAGVVDDSYSWPFTPPPAARPGRRRFWQRW